ncbi:MAG: FAD binding domain-containing protein, partial [Acidobacteriota bacterium]
MGSYLRATRLSEALGALSAGDRVIVAGGTDFYPARVGRPLNEDVLDISRVRGLRGIEERDDHFHIGALTTWSDLLRTPLPPWLDGLKLAAREVGGVQIQNTGTLCGNICNASPAADGVPNLMTLEADVQVASVRGNRTVHIAELITGNRQTVLDPDELVTGLTLPKPKRPARAHFLKLGARRYLVISVVMVAAVIEEGDDTVAAARIAVGSCSVVARRLHELEGELVGRPLNDRLGDVVVTDHLS